MTVVWIRAKKNKLEGRIIGYCPDKKGRPQAIILSGDRVLALKLGEFRVIDPASRIKVVA